MLDLLLLFILNSKFSATVLFKMMTDLEEDPDWDFDEDSNDEESDR